MRQISGITVRETGNGFYPGKTMGKFTAIGHQFRLNGAYHAVFICECGNKCCVEVTRVKSGKRKSCGCSRSQASTKHGMSRTKLYNRWIGIIVRCHKEYCTHYEYYGGRGIKVCDEWRNSFEAFRDWAMNNGYDDSLTIERIDVDGDYEPSNCVFIPIEQQQDNTSRSLLVTYQGQTTPLSKLSQKFNVDYVTLWRRIKKGWTVEQSLFTPLYRREPQC